MTFKYIDALIGYGRETRLLPQEDEVYARNRILELLRLTGYEPPEEETSLALPEILAALTDYASDNGICENSAASRERFGAALMGLITPPPSAVINMFRELYLNSPGAATDYFYKLCHDTDYISRERAKLDICWKTETQYGTLDITVNLSKPEKDPRDIATAREAPAAGYPACLLCAENEGYSGRAGHPARQNHRIIPIKLEGEDWGIQYSPYVYYNEHCIVLNRAHLPMTINRRVFEMLFSFVRQFPDYFIGSNADLPIVGGSILSHEHFQGGRYAFPMEEAPVEQVFTVSGFGDVDAGKVKWPLTVIRIVHSDPARLVDLAERILAGWRNWSDPSAGICSHTDGTPHNTITPIARKRGGKYEFDLALRSNITSSEHPLGVFHPHAELHNIKKENIGLIEVMGLAVLPSRLSTEMETLKRALLDKQDISKIESIAKHSDWANKRLSEQDLNESSIDRAIQKAIGETFTEVLEHCCVFKRNEAGRAAFERFIKSLDL